MRIYEVHPLVAALLLTMFILGLIAMLVVFPVACIQWMWNGAIAAWTVLPQISVWQAGLLYLAGATLLYLSGLVRMDRKIVDAE